MRIKGYDVAALLKKTWKEIGEDRVAVYAAQMAYTLFFSVFPLLLFFAALLSVAVDRQRVVTLLAGATASLPSGVGDLILTTARSVIFARGAPGLLSFGLLAAAWSGSSIFGSFRQALNAAFDVTEDRPWWKQYLLQLAMLVIAGAALLLATVVLIDGEGIVGWVGDHIGLGSGVRIAWSLLQIPVALAGLVGVLWVQYLILPNGKHRAKGLSLAGAVLATALWIGATLLFRVYVQRFHALNPAYGAIGAIMVLLSWMYYSAFVLLAVGELVSELEAGTGKGRAGATPQGGGEVPHDKALVPLDEAHHAGRWAARARAGERVAPLGADHGGARANANGRGLLSLLQSLGDGAASLARQEIRLARLELGKAAGALGVGTVLVALGGVLALLGAMAVIVALVLLGGDQWLPADGYWAAALVLAAVAGCVAAWAVGRARRLLSTSSLAPYETIETIEEEAEWLREPTTSVTTWR